MRWKQTRLIVGIILAALVVYVGIPGPSSGAEGMPAAKAYGTNQDDMTRAIQLTLSAYGYTVKVDGIYGPQTTKAVMAWQRANGLVIDGIAGPITIESLGLKPAVRVNPPEEVSSEYAPAGLSLCDEMSWYRRDAGLPDAFDAIGYRESRCQNDARPTNSVASRYRGYWSVGVMHINNVVYGPGAAACGIRTETDYYGVTPQQKKASACFAKVLYDYSGMNPWRLG